MVNESPQTISNESLRSELLLNPNELALLPHVMRVMVREKGIVEVNDAFIQAVIAEARTVNSYPNVKFPKSGVHRVLSNLREVGVLREKSGRGGRAIMTLKGYEVAKHF